MRQREILTWTQKNLQGQTAYQEKGDNFSIFFWLISSSTQNVFLKMCPVFLHQSHRVCEIGKVIESCVQNY